MRLRLATLATTLAALVPAASAHAGFFGAEPIDGPNPDIQSLGDVDVARDGSGAAAYVKRDGGVDHIFVTRLVDGAWTAGERVDAGLDAASAQPAVAASDGGRLVVVFISGGQAFAVVRPAGAPAWTAPQQLAAGASNPSVDMSIHGNAYTTFTAGGDLRAARLDRTTTTFTVLDQILDIDGAHDTANNGNRSRVAVAADGTAVAVWGEAGHVYARRLFNASVSQAPLDLNVGELEGHAAGAADMPDVDIEDDSSFAWVSFRQQLNDGGVFKPRGIARRLRGSQAEDPVVVDGQGWGGEGSAAPDVDLNGKGEGLATAGSVGGTAFSSILKDDKFNPGVPIGGAGAPSQPLGAIAETTDRVVGYVQVADGTVHGRFYDDKPNVRTVPLPGEDVTISTGDFGPVDAKGGFDVAANRVGDVVLVFVQGTGDQRRLVSAVWDRGPGAFRISSSSKWRNPNRSPLAWGAALDLWGPLTYSFFLDGVPLPNVTTQGTKLALLPGVISEGEHTWRVVATDRRGQTVTTPVKPLRIDATPPEVSFSVKRKRRVATVTAKAADVIPPSGKAAGVKFVRIEFGDGTGFVLARQAAHRYGRTGAFTIRVSATDGAGNASVAERRIHIGGK